MAFPFLREALLGSWDGRKPAQGNDRDGHHQTGQPPWAILPCLLRQATNKCSALLWCCAQGIQRQAQLEKQTFPGKCKLSANGRDESELVWRRRERKRLLTDLGIVGAKWEAAWTVERTEAGTVAV